MSEVKLLPMPEKENDVAVDGEGNEAFFEFFTDEQMESYARANMEPLIAENERLAEALRYAVEQVPELATVPGIAAALDQARGKGGGE